MQFYVQQTHRSSRALPQGKVIFPREENVPLAGGDLQDCPTHTHKLQCALWWCGCIGRDIRLNCKVVIPPPGSCFLCLDSSAPWAVKEGNGAKGAMYRRWECWASHTSISALTPTSFSNPRTRRRSDGDVIGSWCNYHAASIARKIYIRPAGVYCAAVSDHALAPLPSNGSCVCSCHDVYNCRPFLLFEWRKVDAHICLYTRQTWFGVLMYESYRTAEFKLNTGVVFHCSRIGKIPLQFETSLSSALEKQYSHKATGIIAGCWHSLQNANIMRTKERLHMLPWDPEWLNNSQGFGPKAHTESKASSYIGSAKETA